MKPLKLFKVVAVLSTATYFATFSAMATPILNVQPESAFSLTQETSSDLFLRNLTLEPRSIERSVPSQRPIAVSEVSSRDLSSQDVVEQVDQMDEEDNQPIEEIGQQVLSHILKEDNEERVYSVNEQQANQRQEKALAHNNIIIDGDTEQKTYTVNEQQANQRQEKALAHNNIIIDGDAEQKTYSVNEQQANQRQEKALAHNNIIIDGDAEQKTYSVNEQQANQRQENALAQEQTTAIVYPAGQEDEIISKPLDEKIVNTEDTEQKIYSLNEAQASKKQENILTGKRLPTSEQQDITDATDLLLDSLNEDLVKEVTESSKKLREEATTPDLSQEKVEEIKTNISLTEEKIKELEESAETSEVESTDQLDEVIAQLDRAKTDLEAANNALKKKAEEVDTLKEDMAKQESEHKQSLEELMTSYDDQEHAFDNLNQAYCQLREDNTRLEKMIESQQAQMTQTTNMMMSMFMPMMMNMIANQGPQIERGFDGTFANQFFNSSNFGNQYGLRMLSLADAFNSRSLGAMSSPSQNIYIGGDYIGGNNSNGLSPFNTPNFFDQAIGIGSAQINNPFAYDFNTGSSMFRNDRFDQLNQQNTSPQLNQMQRATASDHQIFI